MLGLRWDDLWRKESAIERTGKQCDARHDEQKKEGSAVFHHRFDFDLYDIALSRSLQLAFVMPFERFVIEQFRFVHDERLNNDLPLLGVLLKLGHGFR